MSRSVSRGTWLIIVRAVVSAVIGSWFVAPLAAQSPGADYNAIRQWGTTYVDSESRRLPAIDIDFDGENAALVRADGRIYVQGPDASGVCRPPGTAFVDVEMGYRFALGLRTDGTVEGWGDFFGFYIGPIPPLPLGVTYVGAAAGIYHAVLLRSDGQVSAIGLNAYGELNVPTLSPGVTFVKVKSQRHHTVALLSDGNIVGWGDNSSGQTSVPPLPAGVVYTDVSCGVSHALAVRSDGQIVGWGSNISGESVAPALPSGMSYELCAAGSGYSIAWRSDGSLIGWGDNALGRIDVPATPPGQACVQIEAGASAAMARWSDGSVAGWGGDRLNGYGCPDPTPKPGQSIGDARFVGAAVGWNHSLFLRADGAIEGIGEDGLNLLVAPQPPVGLTYSMVGCGTFLSLALRSDGALLAWGANGAGQASVPTLPPGVRYTDFAAAHSHVVAIRSDGQVEAFGNNGSGECNVPPLPAGTSYVDADAFYMHSLFLRSDGALLHAGSNSYWTSFLPSAAPSERQFVDIATGQFLGAAVLSDGSAQVWDGVGAVPALPWGVYYVEVDCGDSLGWLRRTDGEVVVFGSAALLQHQQYSTPVLDAGTSYIDISAGHKTVVARVGPTCTYVGVHPGCAGSLPATRLVPRDTPRIGEPFEVRLFDLPHDIAVIGMAFQQIAPVDLVGIGIPGCELVIAADGVQLLVGQDQQAVWSLPIPDLLSLVGMRFYNQALVLDVNAGNPFGAVLSDAMEGVVGYP